MGRRNWVLSVVVGFLSLASLVGCGQTEVAMEPGQSSKAGADGEENGRLMVNRIAYINNSGDLLLINPDGTGEERFTGDVQAGVLSQALQRGDSYSWPTWVPDGSRVVASRISISGQTPGLSLQLFDVSTGRMTSAYENSVPAPVADGAPHYIYWSPNGRYLSFLAPSTEGLALMVRDFQGPDEAAAVVVGAPLYYHWSENSQAIAVHTGDRLLLTEPRPDGVQANIDADAVGFRAPALSPDGRQLAYAATEGEVHGVFVRSVGSVAVRRDRTTAAPDGNAGNGRVLLGSGRFDAGSLGTGQCRVSVAQPSVPLPGRWLPLIPSGGRAACCLLLVSGRRPHSMGGSPTRKSRNGAFGQSRRRRRVSGAVQVQPYR